MSLKVIDILLVEDNPDDAEMTQRALRRDGLADRLHHVKDGVEALDCLFARGEFADRAGDAAPQGRAARPEASARGRARGAAAGQGRRAPAHHTGGGHHLVPRGSRPGRELRAGGEQLRGQAGRLRAVHAGRVQARHLLAAHQPARQAMTRHAMSCCRKLAPSAWLLAALASSVAVPQAAARSGVLESDGVGADVTDIDLEDLLRVRVTSVARKEQALGSVPAAITVLRNEDIVRPGATSLAEALRAVPGLLVARSDANSWVVTARGFSDTVANKLLVLIDGRTVYSPLHSGVFWDVQDVLLEDVDRIEVIRGPGSSLWGSNAINGIINVITKSAAETTGGLLSSGWGTEESHARLRQGFALGASGHGRVHVRYADQQPAADGLVPGRAARDDLRTARAGFRLDWSAGSRDSFTLMGDAYRGSAAERVTKLSLTAPFMEAVDARTDLRGADVVFRWGRSLAGAVASPCSSTRTTRRARTNCSPTGCTRRIPTSSTG